MASQPNEKVLARTTPLENINDAISVFGDHPVFQRPDIRLDFVICLFVWRVDGSGWGEVCYRQLGMFELYPGYLDSNILEGLNTPCHHSLTGWWFQIVYIQPLLGRIESTD